LLDLPSYDAYMEGSLVDYPLPEDNLKKALAKLPKI